MPNVLSPRDLVSRPDNMDKTVPHTASKGYLAISPVCNLTGLKHDERFFCRNLCHTTRMSSYFRLPENGLQSTKSLMGKKPTNLPLMEKRKIG